MIKIRYLISSALIYCFLSLTSSSPSLTSTQLLERIEQQSLTVDFQGEQIANEFQLINHADIFESKNKNYAITRVSPLVISNNDIVELSYFATKPSKNDWIGAYSPADANITHSVPVKYALCTKDSNYMKSGSGFLRFNFTNLRDDVSIHYFTGSIASPVLVSTYEKKVSFLDNNEPLRPRIVPVGSNYPDTFKLLWTSSSSKMPTLYWGTESGIYEKKASAETSQIDRSQMCGAPANSTGWRDVGLIHTALFKGMLLMGGTKVYYIFGDIETDAFSQEMVFNVPSAKGIQPSTRPTKVILYDDMGRGSRDDSYTWNEYGRPSYYTAEAVGAEVATGDVDAIYHGGDVAYATGYMAVWDFFLNMISPISASVLYLTTVGNHESDYPNSDSFYQGTDSGGECGVMATTLLPQPYPATTKAPWWSYDVGIIHLIGMSTEHDFRIGSPQHSWLEADLKAVNRSITPWIIFGGHRAMYINSDWTSSATHTGDIEVMDLLIQNVEPLLFKYRVNLGFYGHNHVVQRQSAVFNKKVIQKSVEKIGSKGEKVNLFRDPQATVHMVIGTAGAAFTKNSQDGDDKPEWNEMYFYKWGYARVMAVNSSYLSWEWVEGSSGEVHDRMGIEQVTDFDEKPNWILDGSNGGDESSSDGEKEGTLDSKTFTDTMNETFTILVDYFLFGYGFVFFALFVILIVWRVTFLCMPTPLPLSDIPSSPSLIPASVTPSAPPSNGYFPYVRLDDST